jgi:hypothetical protein
MWVWMMEYYVDNLDGEWSLFKSHPEDGTETVAFISGCDKKFADKIAQLLTKDGKDNE